LGLARLGQIDCSAKVRLCDNEVALQLKHSAMRLGQCASSSASFELLKGLIQLSERDLQLSGKAEIRFRLV